MGRRGVRSDTRHAGVSVADAVGSDTCRRDAPSATPPAAALAVTPRTTSSGESRSSRRRRSSITRTASSGSRSSSIAMLLIGAASPAGDAGGRDVAAVAAGRAAPARALRARAALRFPDKGRSVQAPACNSGG